MYFILTLFLSHIECSHAVGTNLRKICVFIIGDGNGHQVWYKLWIRSIYICVCLYIRHEICTRKRIWQIKTVRSSHAKGVKREKKKKISKLPSDGGKKSHKRRREHKKEEKRERVKTMRKLKIRLRRGGGEINWAKCGTVELKIETKKSLSNWLHLATGTIVVRSIAIIWVTAAVSGIFAQSFITSGDP